ncbi:hypothetical protein [Polaromonas sp. C04]|uniref:hypothetical protein n=1 Tax=Polaromonas sp. C04 TaxID=1945857 RepID=UPI00098520A1|nr:hypothetical protein [Polaromonas sp. C04]OOG53133.1 hypothetical protein B0E49_11690 [Polaromonas sp. C04]
MGSTNAGIAEPQDYLNRADCSSPFVNYCADALLNRAGSAILSINRARATSSLGLVASASNDLALANRFVATSKEIATPNSMLASSLKA